MAKLKCDKPECENFGKELDSVDVIYSMIAAYDEKEQCYDVPALIETSSYYLVCPKCQTVLEEP